MLLVFNGYCPTSIHCSDLVRCDRRLRVWQVLLIKLNLHNVSSRVYIIVMNLKYCTLNSIQTHTSCHSGVCIILPPAHPLLKGRLTK